MSLRERLASKQRRRITVPVLVSDPGPDEEAAARAREFLLAELGKGEGADAGRLAELEEASRAADAALTAHVVEVEFEAIPAADFEALIADHTNPDGEVDRAALLPRLAAECSADADLRDVEFWAGILPGWAAGERDHLYASLFSRLNYSVPVGGLGKG